MSVGNGALCERVAELAGTKTNSQSRSLSATQKRAPVCRRLPGKAKTAPAGSRRGGGPALAQDEGTTELPRRGWTEAERVVHQQWIIKCVGRCIGSAPGKNGILADKSPKRRVVISGAIEVEAGRVELATSIRNRVRSR